MKAHPVEIFHPITVDDPVSLEIGRVIRRRAIHRLEWERRRNSGMLEGWHGGLSGLGQDEGGGIPADSFVQESGDPGFGGGDTGPIFEGPTNMDGGPAPAGDYGSGGGGQGGGGMSASTKAWISGLFNLGSQAVRSFGNAPSVVCTGARCQQVAPGQVVQTGFGGRQFGGSIAADFSMSTVLLIGGALLLFSIMQSRR